MSRDSHFISKDKPTLGGGNMKIEYLYFSAMFLICVLLINFIAGCSKTEPDIQKIDFGIVFGNKHAFMIKPPHNWVIDKKLAKENSLGAIFYPYNTEDKYEVYMYATGHDKIDLESPNIEDFINADVEVYKKKPDIKIRKLESIKTFDNVDTHTYEFNYLKENRKEIVSYIDTKSAVCLLVYAYMDLNDNYKYFEDYKSPFVKSFKYLGDDPQKAYKVYKDYMKKRQSKK